MTSRERIIAVLKGNKPDRIPWVPLCSWTYFESLPEYREASNWGLPEALKLRIDFYKDEIRADYMQWGGFPCYRTKSSAKVEVISTRKGNTTYTEYHTSVGTLTSEHVYSEVAHTTYHTKDLLETAEDLKVYQYMLENRSYEPDYDGLAEQLNILGEEGVFFISAPPPPLKSFLLGTMRLKNAIYAIHDYKSEFDNLVKVIDSKNQEIYRILAESPGEVFLDAAVTGTGMISPKIFEEYYLPYTKKYAEILHKRGKLYINHASGEPVGNILEMIKMADIDGLYGLSCPPTVDMKISEVRSGLGNNIAVMGGIDSDFIATKTTKEIQDRTRFILSDVAPGHNFMLATADDTPYGTPIENLRAVSDTDASLLRREAGDKPSLDKSFMLDELSEAILALISDS